MKEDAKNYLDVDSVLISEILVTFETSRNVDNRKNIPSDYYLSTSYLYSTNDRVSIYGFARDL